MKTDSNGGGTHGGILYLQLLYPFKDQLYGSALRSRKKDGFLGLRDGIDIKKLLS